MSCQRLKTATAASMHKPSNASESHRYRDCQSKCFLPRKTARRKIKKKKEKRSQLSAECQRPMSDAAFRTLAKVTVNKNEGHKIRHQSFDLWCSTTAAVRQWAARAGDKPDPKTLRVVKTYEAKMRKTNMTVFRCVIQLRLEKRVVTVGGGSALDRLWCGQTVSKSFNTIKTTIEHSLATCQNHIRPLTDNWHIDGKTRLQLKYCTARLSQEVKSARQMAPRVVTQEKAILLQIKVLTTIMRNGILMHQSFASMWLLWNGQERPTHFYNLDLYF